jgi:hypothetical protein
MVPCAHGPRALCRRQRFLAIMWPRPSCKRHKRLRYIKKLCCMVPISVGGGEVGATPRSSPDRGCEGLRRNPATSDESGRRTVVHPIEPIPTGIANGRCGAAGTTPRRNSEIGFLQPEPPSVNYGAAGQPRTRAAEDGVGLGGDDHAHRQPTATSFGAHPMEKAV